jgi:hypothetical protein
VSLRQRCVAGVTATLAAVLLAGCGGLPHARPSDVASKRAATESEAASALAEYAAIRAQAAKTADVGRLADAEAGSLLDIESATYFASRAFGVTPGAAAISEAKQVWSGDFARYPLWFVVVASAPAEQTQVAAVFVRSSSTEPWRAVLAPRLASATPLPDIETDDGAAALIAGGDAVTTATKTSASALVGRYASVLADPRSRFTSQFETDSFITQMRRLAQGQPTDHIRFRQAWHAAAVRYALRLSDGGALVFADLRRVDSYRIVGKHALGFAGSQAEAYLPDPVHRWARLTYAHEVLLLVPPDGKSYAIGQFGGLVHAVGR